MSTYLLKRRCRTGIAPIELLITLPLLAVLFFTLLTTAAAGLLSFEVAVAARNRAWENFEAAGATSSMQLPVSPALESDFAQIFRLDPASRSTSPSPAQAGLVEEFAEARLTFGYEAIVRQLPSAKRRHCVMTDSWDHTRIRFDLAPDEPLSAETAGNIHHQQLCLESRVRAFSPNIRIDAFRQLSELKSMAKQ